MTKAPFGRQVRQQKTPIQARCALSRSNNIQGVSPLSGRPLSAAAMRQNRTPGKAGLFRKHLLYHRIWQTDSHKQERVFIPVEAIDGEDSSRLSFIKLAKGLLLLAVGIVVIHLYLLNTDGNGIALSRFVAILSVLAGLAALLANWFAFKHAQNKNAPAFPIYLHNTSIKITEYAKGTLVSTDSGQTLTPLSFQGECLIEANLPSDEERRKAYIKRYSATSLKKLGADAGFVAFKGPADMLFDPQKNEVVADNIIRLSKLDQLDSYQKARLGNSAFHYELGYSIPSNNLQAFFRTPPVTVEPVEAIEHGLRSLKFAIRRPYANDESHQYRIRVTKLALACDEFNGISSVVMRNPNNQPIDKDVRFSTDGTGLVWHDPTHHGKFHHQDDKTNNSDDNIITNRLELKPGDTAVCHLGLKNPLSMPCEDRLRGEITIELEKSVSGIKGLSFFDALGNKKTLSRPTVITTVISLNLDLGLDRLKIVTPNIKTKEWTLPSGILIDHQVVAKILNVLSKNNYHIRQVREESPQTVAKGSQTQGLHFEIKARANNSLGGEDINLQLSGNRRRMGTGFVAAGDSVIKISIIKTMLHDSAASSNLESNNPDDSQLSEIVDSVVELVGKTVASHGSQARTATPKPMQTPQQGDTSDLGTSATVAPVMRRLEAAVQRLENLMNINNKPNE